MIFSKSNFALILILLFSVNVYPITMTILPFSSADKSWIEEYKVDDGMPRVLEDALINTKMINATDYDLLIAYFGSYEIVASYKILQTNLQTASDFIKETFNSDYIITGEILNFNLKKGGKDTANVEFKVNLIDINSLENIRSFIGSGSYTLPNNSPVYSSEDAFFMETALGWASYIALNKIANEIAKFLKNPPTAGIITRIENNKIYINLGKINNVKKGDEFNIYKIDKVLELPNEKSISTNISNSPKNFIHTNENAKEYIEVRTNENGDVWYTSETLYKYRYYKNIETLIGSAKVIEAYDNFSILENTDKKEIELMMAVKIKN